MFQETKEHPVTEKHWCLSDWRMQVDLAEAAGGFNRQQKAAAAHWDMCAVGEAHRLYTELVCYDTFPSDVDRWWLAIHGRSRPIDATLSRLGGSFGIAVQANNFGWCRQVINDIELRLSQLEKEARDNFAWCRQVINDIELRLSQLEKEARE